MAVLHDRESRFGRIRSIRNEARVLDIDIVDFRGGRDDNLQLPHPHASARGFVLIHCVILIRFRQHLSERCFRIDSLIAALDPGEGAADVIVFALPTSLKCLRFSIDGRINHHSEHSDNNGAWPWPA